MKTIGQKIVEEFNHQFDDENEFVNLSEMIDNEFIKLRDKFLRMSYDEENAKMLFDFIYREMGLNE